MMKKNVKRRILKRMERGEKCPLVGIGNPIIIYEDAVVGRAGRTLERQGNQAANGNYK